MRSPSLLRHRIRQAGIVTVIAVLTVFVSPSRTGNLLAGSARVVSVDQVSEMDAEMCALVPEGMNRALYADEIVRRRAKRARAKRRARKLRRGWR